MNTIYIHRQDFIDAGEEIEQKQSSNLEDPAQLFLKRSFDLFFSLMVMVFICSWLFPIIALGIKLSSKGPVVQKQLRHGKCNIPFYCYKFRTVGISAGTGTSSPGMTKIGYWLKRTGLEDLPQVYNVIEGNMSIVGPKAYPVSMSVQFAEEIEGFVLRYAVNPGIVSLAPTGNLDSDLPYFYGIYSKWRLDSFYVQKWSIYLDMAILTGKAASLFNKRQFIISGWALWMLLPLNFS